MKKHISVNSNAKPLRVGDLVRYERKTWMVSNSKGWWLNEGSIDIIQQLGIPSLIVTEDDVAKKVKLFKRREDFNFWEFFKKNK